MTFGGCAAALAWSPKGLTGGSLKGLEALLLLPARRSQGLAVGLSRVKGRPAPAAAMPAGLFIMFKGLPWLILFLAAARSGMNCVTGRRLRRGAEESGFCARIPTDFLLCVFIATAAPKPPTFSLSALRDSSLSFCFFR